VLRFDAFRSLAFPDKRKSPKPEGFGLIHPVLGARVRPARRRGEREVLRSVPQLGLDVQRNAAVAAIGERADGAVFRTTTIGSAFGEPS